MIISFDNVCQEQEITQHRPKISLQTIIIIVIIILLLLSLLLRGRPCQCAFSL